MTGIARISAYFVHRCDIERLTESRSTSGAILRETVAIATAVPCRMRIASERVVSPNLGNMRETVYTVLLPAATAVRTGDRVTNVTYPHDGPDITEPADIATLTENAGPFRVESVKPRRNGRGAINHISVDLKVIE